MINLIMMSEITRVFQIAFPSFLKTRYDFLQTELDRIINDPVFRPQIDQLDPDEFYLSEYYRELKRICQRIDQTDWKTGDYIINNPSWHWRILAENIRSTMSSLALRRKIYSILEKYDFVLTEDCQLELETLKKDSYFSPFVIENIQRSKSRPSMPTHIGFKLDYAFSSGQMFKMSDDYLCSFQNEDGTWTDVQLVVPGTIREEFTGKLLKPVFIKRSDGQYVGHARYCVEPKSNPNAKNILGVNIGDIKPYSAVVLYPNKTVSSELLPSRQVFRLSEKISQLLSIAKQTAEKVKRVNTYITDDIWVHPETILKQENRMDHKNNIRSKITHLKEPLVTQEAHEIVALAWENNCKEIHIENLKWAKDLRTYWNFADFRRRLEEIAEIYGIKVVLVNPAYTSVTHPVTGEHGQKKNRNIHFSTGEIFDRDYLAAINIARTKPKGLKYKPIIIKTYKPKSHTPKMYKVNNDNSRKGLIRKRILTIYNDCLTNKNKVPQTVVYLPIFDVANTVTTKLVLMSYITKQQSYALRQKQCDGYSLTEYPFNTIFEGI